MKNQNDQLLMELLKTEWQLLDASLQTLLQSVEKCTLIGSKPQYSFEEQESFDSLTSKFNRTSDLFTQKIIRTAWMLLHEPFVPFIDLMNTCEKIKLIRDADQMIGIRDMRNQISHEYIPEALRDLVPEVIEFTKQLTENINCCYDFLTQRKWINYSEE
ncbi:MAG TPA: hypothetical protein DCL77_08740 [Prolixibacteraceae bacterium]|jgi:hypothetical protein|nr:hypothetical protein [Prolixibacteraceae bacterium]